jgi:hypothetical protein
LNPVRQVHRHLAEKVCRATGIAQADERDNTSLVSASIATDDQTSPAMPRAARSGVTRFCLQPTNDQISSIQTRFAAILRIVSNDRSRGFGLKGH